MSSCCSTRIPALGLLLCVLTGRADPAAEAPAPETTLVPAKASASAYPFYGNTAEDLLPYRQVEPHHRYWLNRLPFRGPGHDYPDPPDLTSLKVGLLSPPTNSVDYGLGSMTRYGVLLAVEEANAALDPGELPFELIEKADSPQWGSAANIAVEFVDEGALAFIGTIDGDATHVALRVALKAEIFIVNCSDPDPTLTETQIPWLIRVFPDNRQGGNRLAEQVVKERGHCRIVVLRSNDRPGRVGVRPFVNAVRRLGCPVLQEVNFSPGARTFDYQVELIRQAGPEAVVFWGNPEDIGAAAAQLRTAGVEAAFFGFDRLLDPAYVRSAGEAAEGTVAVALLDPNRSDPVWTGFVARFQQRFGEQPEAYAAYAYDGTRMLLQAIREVGPNRYRIRDRMAAIDSYEGVTGRLRFDGRWDNVSPVGTAEFRQGKWAYLPPPQASKPTP